MLRAGMVGWILLGVVIGEVRSGCRGGGLRAVRRLDPRCGGNTAVRGGGAVARETALVLVSMFSELRVRKAKSVGQFTISMGQGGSGRRGEHRLYPGVLSVESLTRLCSDTGVSVLLGGGFFAGYARGEAGCRRHAGWLHNAQSSDNTSIACEYCEVVGGVGGVILRCIVDGHNDINPVLGGGGWWVKGKVLRARIFSLARGRCGAGASVGCKSRKHGYVGLAGGDVRMRLRVCRD
ncbi:hypothetical protein Tco_0270773 [Tanacetum coccineum]